tara:strand:+ start:158 stop:559 length:402 start_codon:yes stop_codon:yes gene_type:complete
LAPLISSGQAELNLAGTLTALLGELTASGDASLDLLGLVGGTLGELTGSATGLVIIRATGDGQLEPLWVEASALLEGLGLGITPAPDRRKIEWTSASRTVTAAGENNRTSNAQAYGSRTIIAADEGDRVVNAE